MKSFSDAGVYWIALLDLGACLAGFGAATLVENQWTGVTLLDGPDPWIAPWVLSAVVAWLVMVFPESQWNEGLRLWVDGYLAVVGANLLMQCALLWLFGTLPASWFVILLGSTLSITLFVLLRKWVPNELKKNCNGILLVGFDDHTPALAEALKDQRILGAIESEPAAVPAGVLLLGGPDRLSEVCETKPPAAVILAGKPAGVAPRLLLQLHYSGIDVKGTQFWCEKVLQRVPWQYLQPSDLLFFLNPKTSRGMLAFQAVYKNLIGLALRVIFAPLLILTSLLIVVFTGGPALEHIECLGFRRTPFQMLRFRTTGADGCPTRIGRLIAKLHLTNLPQLMNVVRGEMTLFGPAPVRTVFALRLGQLMPAHGYRYTVKPGIFEWLDANRTENQGLPEEIQRLEYDLYYIKQESPSLDLDILMRTLFGPSQAKPQAPVAVVVRHS